MRVTAKGHGQMEKTQEHVSQLEEGTGELGCSGNSQKEQRERTVTVISRGKLPSECVLRYNDIAVRQPCGFSMGNEESLHDVAVQSDRWYPWEI